MKYFLCGIKGSGLASIAHILKDKGYEVVGSDVNSYVYTEDDLLKRNIKIYKFNEYVFNQEDIVIYGHSFKDSMEVNNAKKICKETYEYHEYLNKLISESKLSIAICGSHGKTYTTGLISYIINNLTNVSYLIGDGEGKYNGNDIFVFEACEYQDHFLIYKPDICIILNIDYDHTDYFKNIDDYINSFQQFADNSNLVIINKDDKNSKKIKHPNSIYYSIKELNNIILKKEGYMFNIDNKIIKTNVYGEKHLSNILSAIKLFDYLKIERKDYIQYFDKFCGVKRRFKEIIVNGDIYIDDYVHHPNQIRYTLEMIKNKYPDYELIVFFKPDRSSRFLTFYKEIATSLEQANYAVIMDFPSCNEEKIDLNLLINLNINKFYHYNKKILKKIKKIKNKVVVSLSSKNMQEVYENIFIKTHL